MKIYTKTGDKGTTGLAGGRRVSKGYQRVEAYGTVDELNTLLGLALTLVENGDLRSELLEIQSRLFVLGGDLAAPPTGRDSEGGRRVQILPAHRERLEKLIDRYDECTPPLKNFILPGGAPLAAALHVCRAVCRRAERCAVRLSETEEVNLEILIYLNRLSDLLFVLARWANHQAGFAEPVWSGMSEPDPEG